MSETIFAIVENDVIINTVVADVSYDNPSAVNITDLDPRPGIGWVLDQGVFVDPDPQPEPEPRQSIRSTTYPAQDFLRNFTVTERNGIFSSTNVVIVDFLNMLQFSKVVDITDNYTINFMNTLVSEGIITQTRYDEIL